MAHPGGRPTKYKEEYCDQLKEYMSSGMPYETFAVEIGVARSTIYKWEKEFPQFSDAKKEGREMQYKWWLVEGRRSLWQEKDIKFNSTVWIFCMKNMFGWSDKRDDPSAVDPESKLPNTLT